MIAAAVAWMLLSAVPQSAAQTAPAPAQDETVTRLGDVIVDGQVAAAPLRERAQAFVETLSEAPGGKALGRWNTRVCVGVANMPTAAAQTVIDRIAVVGGVLGVQFGRPGCKADVLIIAAHTADADTVAQTAVRRNRDMFRPSPSGTDLGPAALQAFEVSAKPVRWWHVAMPTNIETGAPAVILNGEDAYTESSSGDPDPIPRVTMVNTMSRLRSAIRNDLNRVTIIVDVDKAGSVPLSALADYLTLITLAQIDPSADVSSADSILNLFSATDPAASRPTGLTEWDAAFLVALYNSDPNPGIVSHQRRDLGARVTRLIGRETH